MGLPSSSLPSAIRLNRAYSLRLTQHAHSPAFYTAILPQPLTVLIVGRNSITQAHRYALLSSGNLIESIVAAHYASLRHSPAFPKPIPAICSDEPRSGSEHHCLHPSRHWLWRTPTLAPTRHKPVGVPSFKSDVVTHHHQPSAPTIPIALRQAHSKAIPDSVMELDSPPAPRHSVKAQSPSELPAKESLGDIVDGQHQGKGAPLAKRGLGRPHACTFSARRFYPGKTSPVGRQPPPVIFKRGYAQKKSIPEYTSKLVLFNHNGILASVPTPRLPFTDNYRTLPCQRAPVKPFQHPVAVTLYVQTPPRDSETHLPQPPTDTHLRAGTGDSQAQPEHRLCLDNAQAACLSTVNHPPCHG